MVCLSVCLSSVRSSVTRVLQYPHTTGRADLQAEVWQDDDDSIERWPKEFYYYGPVSQGKGLLKKSSQIDLPQGFHRISMKKMSDVAGDHNKIDRRGRLTCHCSFIRVGLQFVWSTVHNALMASSAADGKSHKLHHLDSLLSVYSTGEACL